MKGHGYPMIPKNFSTTKILVVGDVMLDEYWHCDVTRISPEAPVPVAKMINTSSHPGGAANVACNCAALGVNVSTVYASGYDADSEAFTKILDRKNINSEAIKDHSAKIIRKLRIVDKGQQLIRVDFEQTLDLELSHRVIKRAIAIASEFNAVILSDYGKGCIQSPQKLIKYCQSLAIPVLVDPKGADYSKYEGATIITPNISEFEQIAGKSETLMEIEQKSRKMINELNLQAILVTMGDKGMMLVEKNSPAQFLNTKAVKVFDVTGAGDTVIATMASCIGSGLTLSDSAHLANIAAGIVVGKRGTATASLHEINQHKCGWDTKIYDETRLSEIIEEWRATGNKVVITNGCFDILHYGHLKCLDTASQYGDKLVVLLNSDASTKQLKGPERPINNENFRASALAALQCVDAVIIFNEPTPFNLIKLLKPDVLVKGGDYCVEKVVGAQEVLSSGGAVYIVPHVSGHSTTEIIKKIREN